VKGRSKPRRSGRPGTAVTIAPCNPALLAPYNSYGVPSFVERGYYQDSAFACAHCHVEQVWRAAQQKWWYEVAKGHVETRAKLCRACRAIERRRKRLARTLLTFEGAVRENRVVDRWLRAIPGELGAIARRWFAAMRSCGSDVRDLLHDGCPTACVEGAGFAYVATFTAHVNVGFFHGVDLADPAGLLEGTGRSMRHVKLRPGEEIDEAALARVIDASYADVTRRVRESAAPPSPGRPSHRRGP
jgi:hypothetical protein